MLEVLGWSFFIGCALLALVLLSGGFGALIGNAWVGISKLIKGRARP
jgi:hypothetical protein